MEWAGEAAGMEDWAGSRSAVGPSGPVLSGEDTMVAGGSLAGELVVSSRTVVALRKESG